MSRNQPGRGLNVPGKGNMKVQSPEQRHQEGGREEEKWPECGATGRVLPAPGKEFALHPNSNAKALKVFRRVRM